MACTFYLYAKMKMLMLSHGLPHWKHDHQYSPLMSAWALFGVLVCAINNACMYTHTHTHTHTTRVLKVLTCLGSLLPIMQGPLQSIASILVWSHSPGLNLGPWLLPESTVVLVALVWFLTASWLQRTLTQHQSLQSYSELQQRMTKGERYSQTILLVV